MTSWTEACQAPLSMGFCRQEYWSGLPFPSPGDLPNPRTEPMSAALEGGFFSTEPPGKPIYGPYVCIVHIYIYLRALMQADLWAHELHMGIDAREHI